MLCFLRGPRVLKSPGGFRTLTNLKPLKEKSSDKASLDIDRLPEVLGDPRG